ncbi:uncharacterized protein LOC119390722 [Rhipicephalus sanguineus]|uniref:uncharacterized protein LOC119390722 n=1 Tax=Rhipicephalus sanguineus TaxID=34632 RepID=UPI001895DDB0|nr:uncharacterized protein LOC119390722 [Rhipicephalus sanguineus]
MDVTRWGLALFAIVGVVLTEAQASHSRPLFCHRLTSKSTHHVTQCTYPCALSHGHPSRSYGILFLAEEDGTPCCVGHCMNGVCVPAQDHALNRQKRSLLLTYGLSRAGKRIKQLITQGRGV